MVHIREVSGKYGHVAKNIQGHKTEHSLQGCLLSDGEKHEEWKIIFKRLKDELFMTNSGSMN